MATTAPGVRPATQDVTAILDSDTLRQLFIGAHIMGATVRDTSKYTQYKVEDGSVRNDGHRYFNPIEIDLPLLITDDTRDLYQQLKQAYRDGTNLIIQTSVDSYDNMGIQEMPYDQRADQGDSLPIVIKLIQVDITTPEFGTLPPSKVANKSQSSTLQKGNQQTTEAAPATRRRASVLYGVLN